MTQRVVHSFYAHHTSILLGATVGGKERVGEQRLVHDRPGVEAGSASLRCVVFSLLFFACRRGRFCVSSCSVVVWMRKTAPSTTPSITGIWVDEFPFLFCHIFLLTWLSSICLWSPFSPPELFNTVCSASHLRSFMCQTLSLPTLGVCRLRSVLPAVILTTFFTFSASAQEHPCLACRQLLLLCSHVAETAGPLCLRLWGH